MSNNIVNLKSAPPPARNIRQGWIESVLALGRDKAPNLALETLLAEGRELAWAQALKVAGADDLAVEISDEAEQEWLIDVSTIADPEIRETVARYAAVVCRIDVFLDDFRNKVMRCKGNGR